jgi:hypothetical protein
VAKEVDVLTNPLAVDKETVEEFKIPAEADVPPVMKLGFLQGQLEELQHQSWRERVNIVHARRLQQSDVEALRLKGNNNLSEHKNSVKQFADGILMIKRMIEQLREEYPELKASE